MARGVLAAVAGLAALAAGAAIADGPGGGSPADPPRLVLVLVVDQLRQDRLDPALPGGLGRLAREGRVFADARIDHAHTETCPGHVTILTGVHPGRAGVPGNQFVDRATGRVVYCVEDPEGRHREIGGEAARSPGLIRVDALGDWLRRAHPKARVFAVSAKDRAAILLGGRRPDGAFWIDSRRSAGFTTSRYYRADLPAWVRAFNGEGEAGRGFLAELPDAWVHPSSAPGARADDFPGESPRYGTTSPHPLADGDPLTAVARLLATPFVDEVTLDFALELLRREGLGRDGVADLLAVSLSATDMVGHLYGPESQEARDTLHRVDGALGRFLDAVESEVGPGRTVVALTSDHGVMPLPEWLDAVGASECPVPGGRVDARRLLLELDTALHRELDPPGAPDGRWLAVAGYRFTVNRRRAATLGVPVGRVVEAARRWLEAVPAVQRVWTPEEVESRADREPLARLFRNSWDPERGGDFEVQVLPTCLLSPFPFGTSHGTPWPYDREVPLVFRGPGVRPGVVRGPARPVDVAPTLAELLGIPVPPGLDGRPLPLR